MPDYSGRLSRLLYASEESLRRSGYSLHTGAPFLLSVVVTAFVVGWYSSSLVVPWARYPPQTASDVVLGDVVLDAADYSQPRVLDASDLPAPNMRAEAGIVFNPRTNEIVWGSGEFTVRPIASITKLMTALVVLDQNPDFGLDVVIDPGDVRRASVTYLRRRERVTLDNLLHLALIGSDNGAARVLARASGLGTKGFVEAMNRKAEDLGLHATGFVDPTGLHEDNVSTPYDVARLISHAVSQPKLAGIMRVRSYRMRTNQRNLRVRNTNRLLQGRYLIQGGKTGYIDEAGYCLAAVTKLPGSDTLAIVVLGASTNSGRFREVRRLADWVSTDGASLIQSGVQRAD